MSFLWGKKCQDRKEENWRWGKWERKGQEEERGEKGRGPEGRREREENGRSRIILLPYQTPHKIITKKILWYWLR